MKLFSIIVVSLNTKHEFNKTFKSIGNQNFKNYEIIIVDGYSTDGTISILKKIKKKNTKILIEKDKGIYDAMNKGIGLSKGKWIIFLNSGDVFCERNILKKISKKKIETQDILFGNTIVSNNNFKYLLRAKHFNNNTFLMPFCHQSVLVKSELIKKMKFSLKYKIASDFNFFLKCFNKKKKFCKLDFSISKISSEGLSDKNRTEVYSEYMSILVNNNSNYFLVYKVFILKLLNYLKKIVRVLLPNYIVTKLLKIKYKKNII